MVLSQGAALSLRDLFSFQSCYSQIENTSAKVLTYIAKSVSIRLRSELHSSRPDIEQKKKVGRAGFAPTNEGIMHG